MSRNPLRTPSQRQRRRALHSAAAGRTAVILYICLRDPGHGANEATTILRRYALARDWEVAEVVFCEAPTPTPLDERAQWAHVRHAITEHHIQGVVALEGQLLAIEPVDHVWIAEHGAFLCEVSADVPQPGSELAT